MIDINGRQIKIGDTVKTMQPGGGVLPPGDPYIGIVEETKDAFGNDTLQIRFKKPSQHWDTCILLHGKINEVI